MKNYLSNNAKNLTANSFEKMPSDFYGLVKDIIDRHEKNPKKDKKSFFACFSKPKKKITIQFKLNIKEQLLDFRRTITEFNKKMQDVIKNDTKSEKYFNFEQLVSNDSINVDLKIQRLSKKHNIENHLKDEVDKYAQFFNINKILEKQKRKIKSQNQKLAVLEDAKTSNDCIICMENQRGVIFYPCLHLICCEVCVKTKLSKNCPQCFQKIDSKLQI
jgi:hypothetical protein